MSALNLSSVSVRYEGADRLALDDISLEVDEGEIVLVLGLNNSGKSTLCMLLNGLVPHAISASVKGSVEVFGRDALRRTVAGLSTEVGIVFQEPENQLFCMSAEEEVAFGPENLATPREEIAARVEWALDTVGLKGYNSRPPASLSGGEKQRLAIAAALSMHPRMLVLDEPAYALDPVGRSELYALLKHLRDRFGMTIIVAGRDAEELSGICDRVVLLKAGHLLRDGRPSDVLFDREAMEASGVSAPELARLSRLLPGEGPAHTRLLTVDDAERRIRQILDTRDGRDGG